MRLLALAGDGASGLRPGPPAGAAAGADHGVRVLAVADGGIDPDRNAADPFADWQLTAGLGAVPRVLA